jgi:hypothetical protein
MDQNSSRWHQVTPSEFTHEREGLAFLAKAVPDQAPYHVFTNFTFQGDNGRRLEVDALVVSPGQINLVELKSWSGHFTGNEHTWRSDWNGGTTHRNPVGAANYKAKLMKSRLETIFHRIMAEHRDDPAYPDSFAEVPWVQECVFLHSEQIRADFTTQGVQNVFGIDGRRTQTNLPGIGNRITEKPRRYQAPIDEGFAQRMLLPALKEITGYRKRNARAGQWLLTSHLDDEEDRQVWSAVNARDAATKTGTRDRAIVRIADVPRNADQIASNKIYQPRPPRVRATQSTDPPEHRGPVRLRDSRNPRFQRSPGPGVPPLRRLRTTGSCCTRAWCSPPRSRSS